MYGESMKIEKSQFRCEHRHTAFEHPLCWKRFSDECEANLEVGYFDIEASNLDADFGWLISC